MSVVQPPLMMGIFNYTMSTIYLAKTQQNIRTSVIVRGYRVDS